MLLRYTALMLPPFGLTAAEYRTLVALKTPVRVQDFLETLPFNFCTNGDTCYSPRRVLEHKTAHCMEGAMLAALALRLQGRRPLILDLEAAAHDDDHVVALFQDHGHWGAISKTNHGVLRYREPIYRSVRELVASYFHEYFDKTGKKTLESFSRPIDLARFDRQNWMTSAEDVWFVPEHLTNIPHTALLTASQKRKLRRADPVEIQAGDITVHSFSTTPKRSKTRSS